MTSTYYGFVTTVLYLFGGMASLIITIKGTGKNGRTHLLIIVPVLIALCLHAVQLYLAVVTPEGLIPGFFNSLSLASWVIVALILILSTRQPIHSLGLILFPASAICIALSILYPSSLKNLSLGIELHIHILFSIITYALFCIAALQAILLAYQDYSLHEHKINHFVRELPPLYSMESLLFHMIGTGFIFLSISLLSGFIYLEDLFAQKLAHKTVFSILAWIVFATLLVGRKIAGWRGKTAVRWTLSGFLLLVLSYFGSKVVLEFILKT